MKCVVLDAMGVIYTTADDVTDLLYPFIVEKGGIRDADRVKSLYVDASLGKMSSAEFWKGAGVDPALEDEYVRLHTTNAGLISFLIEACKRGIELWCLSNDVSEWSKRLCAIHGLDKYFRGFIISGDVHLRKPDPEIFKLLIKRLKHPAGQICFVDDQIRNLDAAAALGIVTMLFDPLTAAKRVNEHKIVRNFDELGEYVAGAGL